MNAQQLNDINDQIQNTLSATLQVLKVNEIDPATVNFPVPTLHAFMSIIVGVVELIPSLHKTNFQESLANLAKMYLEISQLWDTNLLLEDLYDLDQFKSFRTQMLTLIDFGLVSGKTPFVNRASLSSIAFQASNLPELADIIAQQDRKLCQTVRTPLSKLFNQIAEKMQRHAQDKGCTLTREECITADAIRNPKIYWTTKVTARQIRDKTLQVHIRPESSQSQSPKRIRLSDSQLSSDML